MRHGPVSGGNTLRNARTDTKAYGILLLTDTGRSVEMLLHCPGSRCLMLKSRYREEEIAHQWSRRLTVHYESVISCSRDELREDIAAIVYSKSCKDGDVKSR